MTVHSIPFMKFYLKAKNEKSIDTKCSNYSLDHELKLSAICIALILRDISLGLIHHLRQGCSVRLQGLHRSLKEK